MSSNYLHAVAWLKSAPDAAIFLFGDLSERELEKTFLRPYRLGKKILANNRVYDVNEFSAVSIIATESPKDVAIAEYLRSDREATERLNRNSTVFFMGRWSGPEDVDVLEVGENVTGRYVNCPPGEGRTLADIVNHPWVLTVIGGVIAAVVAGAIMGAL